MGPSHQIGLKLGFPLLSSLGEKRSCNEDCVSSRKIIYIFFTNPSVVWVNVLPRCHTNGYWVPTMHWTLDVYILISSSQQPHVRRHDYFPIYKWANQGTERLRLSSFPKVTQIARVWAVIGSHRRRRHKTQKEEIFMCWVQWQRCVWGVRGPKRGLNPEAGTFLEGSRLSLKTLPGFLWKIKVLLIYNI